MFKFFRWFWRKAQAYAAQDLIVYLQKNMFMVMPEGDPARPAQSFRGMVVSKQQLEDFITRRYIMPSRQDDYPIIQQDINFTTNGIPPKSPAESRSSVQSRPNPKI